MSLRCSLEIKQQKKLQDKYINRHCTLFMLYKKKITMDHLYNNFTNLSPILKTSAFS